MAYPPNVIILDTESIVHARYALGSKGTTVIESARRHRLPDATFAAGPVTPSVADADELTRTVTKARNEAGRFERVSLLLPDSWFRVNILELDSVPEKQNEADEVVRWAFRRNLPIRPEELRLRHAVLERGLKTRVLVVAAIEKSLAAVETAFSAAGVEVVLIEPVGLNAWNSITVREQATEHDRVFFWFGARDYTTALFRGSHPLFFRTRGFAEGDALVHELRLSASYLRENLQKNGIERCYVAGRDVGHHLETIGSLYDAPVERKTLRDFATVSPSVDARGLESELAAGTGVFTA